MRLTVALALTALLTLTGCGGQDQTGDVVADDPSTSGPTSTPDDDPEDDGEPTGEVEFELVQLVSATAAGGEGVSETAVALGDEMAVEEFVFAFEEPLQVKIRDAVEQAEMGDHQALYGAVVAIGCDVPPGVHVSSTDSGLVITAKKVASPLPECFAPVTTVALVLVDEAVVG